MLKMQAENDDFRLNITTDKKYVLRPEKNGFVVQNPPFHIVCKIAFYIFFIIKYEPFRVKRSIRPLSNKQKWLDETVCFNFYLTKTSLKVSFRNSTLAKYFHQNLFAITFISPSFNKSILFNWNISYSPYLEMLLVSMIKLLFLFFLSDRNLWCCFLKFVEALIAAEFRSRIF